MSAAISFFVSLTLMPFAIRLGSMAGLVDRPSPGGLKIHATPVSVLGGPVAITGALIGLGLEGGLTSWLLAGVGLATAIGLIDDVRPLSPWLRLAITGCAGGSAALGVVSGGVFLPLATGLVLGVACSNAVNVVDGQDGLAGGLSLIASVSLALVAAVLDVPPVVTLGLVSASGLLVFLVWNRPPARVFLGNGGAYGVGTLLAAQAAALIASGPRGLISAAICLGPFAFELVLTSARRVVNRSSLVVGDRQHSYDLLATRIGSRGRATIAFWLIGAGCGGAGFAAATVPLAAGILIAGLGVVAATIIGLILLQRTAIASSR